MKSHGVMRSLSYITGRPRAYFGRLPPRIGTRLPSVIDEIIAEEFASLDLELRWLDEDADPRVTEAALEGRVKLGALTLNEMRGALGLDPFDAAVDRPMVLTATATCRSRRERHRHHHQRDENPTAPSSVAAQQRAGSNPATMHLWTNTVPISRACQRGIPTAGGGRVMVHRILRGRAQRNQKFANKEASRLLVGK
jgi:hypothetical protein